MSEELSPPTTEPQPVSSVEAPSLSLTDQTIRVDKCLQLLSNRRRRFCLYYLHQADSALSIRDLAELVESSVTPAESSLTDRVLEEAALQLHHTHLPKLRDADLVEVNARHVELSSNPPMPIQDWLSVTATVELGQAPYHSDSSHRR